MDSFDFHTALGDHVGRNGRIDTAAEQYHGTATDTGGQTARTGHCGTMDISRQVTHFYEHRIVGMMDIHLHMGMGLRQSAADVLGQLNGRTALRFPTIR